MKNKASPFLCSFAVLLVYAAPASSQAPVSVEPPVQVSKTNSRFIHDEVVVAADPSHSNRLLACSIMHELGRRPVTNVAYVSNDSGHSWTQAFVFADGLEAYDPTCAYGSDGTAYFAGIQSVSLEHFETKVVLYSSDDGGQHWREPSEIGSLGPNDRPFIAVDDSVGKNRGAVYVAYTDLVSTADASARAVSVFRSTDHGKTFMQLSSLIGAGDPAIPGGIVLSDGTFLNAVRRSSATRAELFSRVSENRTLQPDGNISLLEVSFSGSHLHKIADTYGCALERNGSPLASFAADTSSKAFLGRLYTVWPDSRSGRCEILISHSEDRGKTWSTPFAINDDPPRTSALGPDDCRPAIAVNTGGVVGVLWYDRRDSADDRGWTARFAASIDGGETFLPSVPLSRGQTEFARGQVISLTGLTFGGGSESSQGEMLSALLGYERSHGLDGGDTSGIAADAGGVFHPVWIDNSSGIFQVWTAAVHVTGAAARNGGGGLESLADLSKYVTALFDNVIFDKTRHRIVADLSILNTSRTRLNGPFTLRVLRALSPAGLLRVISADSKDGYSALLELTSQLPDGILEPSQQSRPKRIEIGLPSEGDPDSMFAIEHLLQSGDGSYRTGFIRLDLKLLGHASAF